jgi:ATP phosphoribosyltransferase regulatory subunit
MTTDMSQTERWLLPEGIEELLPEQARVLEGLRRSLLDCYRSWGYELVMPPFVEYLESLLTGVGKDLDLQTFKIIDPITGRMMGVRADMTPQAARIDAHQLKREQPVRLCYLGTVLRTRPDGFGASRAPLQVGAELYGHAGVESDLEILELMLETVAIVGVENVHMDLGHVGIFRGLARQAGLSDGCEAALFDALQRKAVPEIRELLAGEDLSEDARAMLAALAELNGGEEVLSEARTALAAAAPEVHRALDELEHIAARLRQRQVELPLHYDLAELRGYEYQTGVVFAAFVPGHGQEVARGGRYDEIGSIFGRARPATGFSADLKTLIELSYRLPSYEQAERIFAPADDDPQLRSKVRELRVAGKQVICELPGQSGGAVEMGCSWVLDQRDGKWMVIAVGNGK